MRDLVDRFRPQEAVGLDATWVVRIIDHGAYTIEVRDGRCLVSPGAHRIRQAYLVGNSMGGRIATEVALRHPRRVAGIVGLDPAVAFDAYQWLGPVLRGCRATGSAWRRCACADRGC